MSVIRFYDNRMFLYNELNKGRVFHRLIARDICVEYCTLVLIENEYKCLTYRYIQNEKGECEIYERFDWNMDCEDQYFVFLDTLWEELQDDQQIFGVPQKLFDEDFQDSRVVSLTVYTVFDPAAVKKLYKKIIQYRKNNPDIYFPIIRKPIVIWSDDDEGNINAFKAPIKEQENEGK